MSGEMTKGAAWMVLFRLLDRSIGIVSTVILARLLPPGDFGVVAMAMSIIALIELATTFSFELALIQKRNPAREHFDTAWTLNILVALGGAVLTAALAVPASAFYGEPRLTLVMLAVGVAWLISGFENTGTVNFRRNMDFASEFRLMAIKRVFVFAVGVTAAFVLRSYWALVIGMAAGRIAGVALSYWMQPFRPRLSLVCAKELFQFSGWLLANNVASVVLGKVPHFVIGRFFGAQSLGAYSVGAEIAQLPSTELVAPINRAMFPGYSRLASDPAAFRRVCADATAVILLFVFPLSVGIAVLAEPFVGILLGSQWTDAVPVIQILAFAGAVGAITSNNTAAYIALGRPHLTTLILITRVILLTVTVFALAGSKGMVGVAIAEFVAAVGSLAVSLPLLLSTIKMSTRDYAAGLWRPLLASVGMGFAVHAASIALAAGPQMRAMVVQLGVSVLLGAATYPLMIGALWWLSGRPNSAEAQVARHLYGALRHALAR